MYLMYIDESGDTGLINSPTNVYILTAVVVHEHSWKDCLDLLREFRRSLKVRYGILMNYEIHAHEFINKPGQYRYIPKTKRLQILDEMCNEMDSSGLIDTFSIIANKARTVSGRRVFDSPATVFDKSWIYLVQRFENTLGHRNFRKQTDSGLIEKGIIVPDNTANTQVTRLLRRVRRYNVVPSMQAYYTGNRNLPMLHVIEDPFFKDSSRSYFTQLADVISYFVKQKVDPSSFGRKRKADKKYDKWTNIHCLHINSSRSSIKYVE